MNLLLALAWLTSIGVPSVIFIYPIWPRRGDTQMYAQCQRCYQPFMRQPEHSWKLLCLSCFKEKKAQERMRQQYNNFQEQQHQQWWQWNKPRQEAPLIDAVMLRRLIQLCHPDKHKNSEASQLATRWLLEQKEKR